MKTGKDMLATEGLTAASEERTLMSNSNRFSVFIYSLGSRFDAITILAEANINGAERNVQATMAEAICNKESLVTNKHRTEKQLHSIPFFATNHKPVVQ